MRTKLTTATVRLMTRTSAADQLAFVRLPGEEEVRVRHRRARRGGSQWWKCDACGKHQTATCDHELELRSAIWNEVQR